MSDTLLVHEFSRTLHRLANMWTNADVTLCSKCPNPASQQAIPPTIMTTIDSGVSSLLRLPHELLIATFNYVDVAG
jgi:hypothetical protein